MKKRLTLALLSFFFFKSPTFSQINLTLFAPGFTSPVDIKNCGDDRLFIVEQAGYIWIVDTNGVRNPQPFLDIDARVLSGGERGLLGLAFDPDYQNNGFFYVYYTENSHGDIVVSRFSVSSANPDSAVAASEDTIIRIWHPYSNHNGGHIGFNPFNGYFYMGTGDGGSGGDPGNRAQNKDSLLGKILRLDVSDTSVAYSIPPDNPFVGATGRDEIWHLGMRNPWRWSFDRWNGDFWIGDVGQNAWEEVDYQPFSEGGKNYGWRCYEGNGHPYNTNGCQPVNFYDPPIYEYANNGAAIVGGYRYRGANFSNMFGKYFFTDEFTSTYQFRTLEPNGSGGWTATLIGTLGRSVVVAFGEDRWGELYCADYGNGGIYKFAGTPCSPVAYISDEDTLYVCDTTTAYVLRTPVGKNFHYEWFIDGNAIANSDNDTLLATQGGLYTVVATDPAACSTTSAPLLLVWAGPPAVSINNLDTFYCVYHEVDTLTGIPLGGTFSGPGLSGPANRYFDPAQAGPGDHIITYTFTDFTTGCTNSVSMTTHVDLCTDVPNASFIPSMKLYPNPNSGSFTLEYYTSGAAEIGLEVTDLAGRSIYARQLQAETGLQRLPLNLSAMAKGMYLLKLTSPGGTITRRLAIK